MTGNRLTTGTARMRRQAGRVRRRLRSTVGRPGLRAAVHRFDRESVEGSVTVRRSAPPVRVALFLNDIEVATTWATTADRNAGRGRETRPFRFTLSDVWRFARRTDRLTVRVAGVPVALATTGRRHLQPDSSGPRTPAHLRRRMAAGYVFNQRGRLRLSKKLDTKWQGHVLGLFDQVREFADQNFGYELFFMYGTLLGAVREGGFISHDMDFDVAFICSATDGPGAAAELRDLGLALIDAGYEVSTWPGDLHVKRGAGPRIDIFNIYFDIDGRLRLPFGAAGTSVVHKSDWQGVTEIDFVGGRGVIPVNAEQLVEQLYGPGWRRPNPGFRWPLDRVSRAEEGLLTPEMEEEIYWANFYAHNEYDEGSTFFGFVNARPDTPATVIDVGCGDGRDSVAFALAGRRVLGLDRSHLAVGHATTKAARVGVGAAVQFDSVDVADRAALEAALRGVLEVSEQAPVAFYLRFFLHSIHEPAQEALMDVIDACARPGDMFAAEFRTDRDEARAKVHGNHYRRYQNGPAFGRSLRERFGFEVLHEQEATGLSPYGDEDPMLYRVIARRV
jgi:SAM-dependent methyltransferase